MIDTPARLAHRPGRLTPIIGSFLGVLIRRLPAGEPVMLDRSHCETCLHPLGARDLVPVASYLVLRAPLPEVPRADRAVPPGRRTGGRGPWP